MNNKKILYGEDGRSHFLAGIINAGKAVRPTLGVIGKTAIINNGYYKPEVADDGKTILNNLQFKSQLENMGLHMLRSMALATSEKAGDGTATTSVLGSALSRIACDELAGTTPDVIVNRLKLGLKNTLEYLEIIKKPVTTQEELESIATISCLDPELGKLIAETVVEAGQYGVVTIEEGSAFGVTKEVVKGLRVNNGFIADYFVQEKEKNLTVLDDVDIIVTDARIVTNKNIIGVLKLLQQMGSKNAVLFAEEITGEALATIGINFQNAEKGGIQLLPIKITGINRRELLKDIASVTGSVFVTEEIGKKVDDITVGTMGKAGRVVITPFHTTILGGNGSPDAINDRCKAIELQIGTNVSLVEKDELQRRLASLSGGIGVIRVGAYTTEELNAKKHKLDNAVNATRCAMEEGILPGGGTALYHASRHVVDPIFREVLQAPFLQMCLNAGVDLTTIDNNTTDHWIGYNFKTNQTENLLESGVIDSFKVTRLALEHAVSIASIVLTNEVFIIDDE